MRLLSKGWTVNEKALNQISCAAKFARDADVASAETAIGMSAAGGMESRVR